MGQFLGTKAYGVIEVEQSWSIGGKFDGEGNPIQQGGHVALLSNGAYCHVTGLPFSTEEEIKNIFFTSDGKPIKGLEEVYKKVFEWFKHRHDHEKAPLPRIMFSMEDGQEGWPFYETGAPVEKEEELYQCLKPGPVLTAAIIGLHERRKVLAMEAAKAPVTHETVPEPARADLNTPPATPTPVKVTGKSPKVAGKKVSARKSGGKPRPTPQPKAAPAG